MTGALSNDGLAGDSGRHPARPKRVNALVRDIHAALLGLEKRLADIRGRGVYAGYPDRFRCIFIHIPRTAGSAIAEALFAEPTRHASWRIYRYANPRKFRRYFKFAFVRNPWDRLVSSYFYLRDGGNDEADREWSRRHLQCYPDFGSFVTQWVTAENVQTWDHFIPQADFIMDSRDNLMVDFLGRYERLNDDLGVVAERLGCASALARINQSERGHFSTYYDSATAEIVRTVYARDVAALGYADSGPF